MGGGAESVGAADARSCVWSWTRMMGSAGSSGTWGTASGVDVTGAATEAAVFGVTIPMATAPAERTCAWCEQSGLDQRIQAGVFIFCSKDGFWLLTGKSVGQK
jgi:hypothetical protein